MALTASAFPYDLNNLLGGRVRVLIAPIASEDDPGVPEKLQEIIELETPYPAADGWIDLGAARDSAAYSRGFTTEGWEIQQVNSAVVEELTGTARSVSVSIAELREDTIQLIEQSTGKETVNAAVHTSKQIAIPFGEITDLQRYRVAFVAMRKQQSGIVEELEGKKVRGRFVAITINEATIAADDTGIEFDKGALSHVPLTFTAYPASGETEGEEYGRWILEEAGVIAKT